MNEDPGVVTEPRTSADEPMADVEPATDIDPTRRRMPASVLAVSLILLIGGGGLEGYAMSQAASSDPVGRQYALAWALLGAALVVTAWALRGRRWWGAAAAIAVSVVGLFAGMYGVYGVLVLANGVDCAADATGRCPVSAGSWLIGVGLIAVGAASIAIIGLLSGAWGWLTATRADRPA